QACTIDQVERLQHPAWTNLAACLIALGGPEYLHAALLQRCYVRARCRIGPHYMIHRWRSGNRRLSSQTECAQEIICETPSQSSQEISAGRSHENELRPPGELDMTHRRFRSRIPQIRTDGSSGYCLKCGRRNELTCSGGHDHLHLGALLTKAAHEI